MTEMAVAAPLAVALKGKGYESLTPVQKAVLAEGLAGRDALVSAQTGSGKTVAFGLAMAPEVLSGQDQLLFADKPLALIVAPTRELALQVKREFEWLYAAAGAHLASCVGGMDYRGERRALERGAHIVVGTPGRLRDHIERGSLDLSGLRAVVLDEADEMLDLGFAEDLEFILAAAPEDRRTLMFSATVPKEIEALAATFQKNALRIIAQGEARQHVDIEYRAMTVAQRDREHAIFNTLRFYEAKTAIVFCKTRANVSHLFARMSNRGFQAVALSGELSQAERSHALQALRDGRARVCIATDVAARGIDLPGLELVIHADLPSNQDTLLHRSGRTGRAGKKGTSVLIVTPADFRKATRILQGAKVTADWAKAPSAEMVQEKDDIRLLDHPGLSEAPGDEVSMAETLLDQFGPTQVAAAFIRLWREGRSAPEVLSDQPTQAPVAASAPRARSEFGPSVWFRISVGHTGRAEARWLLPKICDAGGIARESIGAIRVQQEMTFVQIAEAVAGRFRETSDIDTGLTMERLAGEPNLDRPERAPRSAKPAPSARPIRVTEREDAAPDQKEARPEPAKPKFARKEPFPREEARDKFPKPREDRPPRHAKDVVDDRKPRTPRQADAKTAYTPRPRSEKSDNATADNSQRKPRWAAGDKSRPTGDKPRAAGYKSHGGDDGKPARSTGYKSHGGEGSGARPPRAEGEKRSYAPKSEEARPFAKRGSAAPKAAGYKSHAGEGKATFARSKPAAPKSNASDTSKRFVPPKKPKH